MSKKKETFDVPSEAKILEKKIDSARKDEIEGASDIINEGLYGLAIKGDIPRGDYASMLVSLLGLISDNIVIDRIREMGLVNEINASQILALHAFFSSLEINGENVEVFIDRLKLTYCGELSEKEFLKIRNKYSFLLNKLAA